VLIIIEENEVCLDIHVYDIIDFNLLLGFPLDELLDKSHGRQDGKPLLPHPSLVMNIPWQSIFPSKTHSRQWCVYLLSHHPSPFSLRRRLSYSS
jgi:hypothetical protein